MVNCDFVMMTWFSYNSTVFQLHFNCNSAAGIEPGTGHRHLGLSCISAASQLHLSCSPVAKPTGYQLLFSCNSAAQPITTGDIQLMAAENQLLINIIGTTGKQLLFSCLSAAQTTAFQLQFSCLANYSS